MVVLAAMQVVALVPTGFVDWTSARGDDHYISTYSTAVACYYSRSAYSPGGDIYKESTGFFNPNYIVMTWGSLAITLSYLTTSYIARLVKLSPCTTLFVRSWLRLKPGKSCKKLLLCLHRQATGTRSMPAKVMWNVLRKSALIVFTLLRATLDLTGSMLWEYADIPVQSFSSSLPTLRYRRSNC